MRIIKKIQSNFRSPEEVMLFVQIFLLATILPLLVKYLTVPHLMKVLTPHNIKLDRKCPLDEVKDRIEKYTLYILSRNIWIYNNICLKRSLIFYHFLRKYGVPVTICFGVRYKKETSHNPMEKKMEGHAWLLSKGRIFLEKNPDETKTYKLTYAYPESKEDVIEKRFSIGIGGWM